MVISISFISKSFHGILGIKVFSTYKEGENIVGEWIFLPYHPYKDFFTGNVRVALGQDNEKSEKAALELCIEKFQNFLIHYLARWKPQDLLQYIWSDAEEIEIPLSELAKLWVMNKAAFLEEIADKTLNPLLAEELNKTTSQSKIILKSARYPLHLK